SSPACAAKPAPATGPPVAVALPGPLEGPLLGSCHPLRFPLRFPWRQDLDRAGKCRRPSEPEACPCALACLDGRPGLGRSILDYSRRQAICTRLHPEQPLPGERRGGRRRRAERRGWLAAESQSIDAPLTCLREWSGFAAD